MAAVNLRASQSALGAYYRRLCGRMDKGKVVTACAHKLARLIYMLVTQGEDYVGGRRITKKNIASESLKI